MRDVDQLRPREREAVALLLEHGPMQRAQIAKIMGCSVSTVGHHMWMCKIAKKAHCIGFGCKAVWHPGPAPESVAVAAREVQHHLASAWRW